MLLMVFSKFARALGENCLEGRSVESTESRLRMTMLLGLPVRAYEGQLLSTPIGVIRGVDLQLDITKIRSKIRPTALVTHVHRLGETASLCIAFASAKLPEHVLLGYVRYVGGLIFESPEQRCRCGSFEHVPVACHSRVRCTKGAGQQGGLQTTIFSTSN